jgi:3-deoxy-D-manno-octulosonic-acid transferase
MWLLYQALYAISLLVAAPVLALLRGRHYLQSLPARLGRYETAVPNRPLWLHAVSVGEVGVAATLASALEDGLPLLVTSVTPTGQARARAAFESRQAAVTYLPLDLGPLVERFLGHFEPRALVLMEGELWPLLLDRVKSRRRPIVMVNGRISDRSFRRMRRMRWLLRPLLDPIDRFGVQSEEDRHRLLELGVEPARVVRTGNLKYDTPEPPVSAELGAALRDLAAGRPLLVAGSTMAGEDIKVGDAFRLLGGGQRALLVLAPRHPERWEAVAESLAREGLEIARRSRPDCRPERPDVLLLDTMGELAALYRHADAAFIGGTLVPTGGHNPLEAARFGIPLAVGPSMENFREIATHFDNAGAWVRVESAEDLAAAWRGWLDDPTAAAAVGERARLLVAEHRGALERTVDLLRSVVPLP